MQTRIFRFGLDYLRLNFCAGFRGLTLESFLDGFSENSNQKFNTEFLGHRFSLTYVGNNQRRMVSFYYGPYNVFFLTKNTDMGISRCVPYTFTFYGTFFYLPELQDCLVTFLCLYMKYVSVSRIDLCLDTNVRTEVLWRWKRTQFKFDDVIRNREHIETFYLGRKKDNKKFFIRVYDKKCDAASKGKLMLTPQYLSEEVVTRIEAQINVLTCKILGITPQAILNYVQASMDGNERGIAVCEQWFASLCMNEQGTFFYSLRGLALSSAVRLRTAKFTGRSSEIEASRYVRVFLSYAKRLQAMGFDVFGFLREHLSPPPVTSPNQQASTVPPS